MKEIVEYETIKFYYEDIGLHREDGPAIEYTNGSPGVWYYNNRSFSNCSQMPLFLFLNFVKYNLNQGE